MMNLFLDESGCLGFNFDNKKTSKHFTIAILATSNNKDISYAVKKTLKRKINHEKSKRIESELKGSRTSFDVKNYFYRQIAK